MTVQVIDTPPIVVSIVDESEIVNLNITNQNIELEMQYAQGPAGPQGPVGPQGPIGDANGAFLVTNRFNEISEDELAKEAARQNLGLSVIDGGTFF